MPRVEHHDHVVHVLRPALGEPAPGGDLDRAPHPVQIGPVPCQQRGDAADARHDLVLEGHPAGLQHLVEDREGGVVQGGVAPHQERPGLAVREVLRDEPLEDLGPRAAPAVHRRRVVRGGPVPVRVAALHQPVAGPGVRVEHRAPQPGQIRLLLALLQNEECVRRADRPDRLEGQMVRVARAYADH